MKFTSKSKEVLINNIISFLDPEVVGFSNTMVIFSLETPDVPTVAFMLRDGKYLRAKMNWTYFDDESELEWKEVTREEFLKDANTHYSLLTLDRVRIDYHQHKWNNDKVNKIHNLEDTICILNDTFFSNLNKQQK